MHSHRFAFPWFSLLMIAIPVFWLSGCDQVGSVVDDVKSSVSGQPEETVAPSTPGDSVSETSAPQVTAPAPAQPSADELLSEFRKLKPESITDSSISIIAASPEAAAAIHELDIRSGNEFSVNGLMQLKAFKNLASLALPTTQISADGLAQLGQIPSLRKIQLTSSTANDAVIAQLASLPNLESLDVAGCRLTPASAAAFGKLARLAVLDLQNTQIDDSVVQALAALPIRELNLSKTRITDAALPYISNIATLESLNVSFTAVTGAGFKGAGKLDVKTLNVGETQFGIDGFIAIKSMQSLEELNVYNSGLVEHKSCNVFRTFPNLKVLHAGANSITNAGMDVFFKGHKSLEVLNLQGNRGITDKGLAALIGIKTLKSLNVFGTGCGVAGAEALKEKLPDCTILCSEGTF